MWPGNRLTELLGIEYPIIQAPMAGSATPELAAAVSNAGGLGSLGCAQMSLEELEENLTAVKNLTNSAYNLNFFAHVEPAAYENPDPQLTRIIEESYRKRDLGTPPKRASGSNTSFNDQKLAVVLDNKPAVVSFHFGLPETSMLQALRDIGCRLLCSATTVAEARYLSEAGMDAIIAQGWEAGGHRGSFEVSDEDFGIGSMALIPQIVDAVDIPVIAAGGIADGRGIAAAFMLGASAVQIGTAFLSCPEADVRESYREVLKNAQDSDTRLTRAFSGRPARARNNPYIEAMAQQKMRIPDFPLMYEYSKPLMQSSRERGDEDFIFQLYGQAAGLNRVLPAAELMHLLVSETDQLLNQASAQ